MPKIRWRKPVRGEHAGEVDGAAKRHAAEVQAAADWRAEGGE